MCECLTSGKHWHAELLIADDDTLIFFKLIRPHLDIVPWAGAGVRSLV